MSSLTLEHKHDAAYGTQTNGEKPHEALELEDSYTPEEEREVLRRIDRTILPMVSLLPSPVAITFRLG